MSIRWDLKPAVKDCRPDTELSLWTWNAVISAVGTIIGYILITSWGVLNGWELLVVTLTIVLAFNAGDMRQLFEDEDEPPTLEDGTIETPHDRRYQPKR